MSPRFSNLPRCLLFCAVASASTASPLAAQVVTALAPLPDAPVFSLAPVRETVLDTLVDVLRFRREHPLDDAQARAIRAIVLRHREAILHQARTRLATARMLRATVEAPDATEEQIREAAQLTGAVIADGAVLRHELATEIQRQLSPEQMQAWHGLLDRIEERLAALLERV